MDQFFLAEEISKQPNIDPVTWSTSDHSYAYLMLQSKLLVKEISLLSLRRCQIFSGVKGRVPLRQDPVQLSSHFVNGKYLRTVCFGKGRANKNHSERESRR